MMSGSTVLKNSAQLCSHRQTQNNRTLQTETKNLSKYSLCVCQVIIKSGRFTCSSCFSCVKHNIWEPTMLAQDWRVNTVRMKGSESPWRWTIDAIWITGSLSASGKIPGEKRGNVQIKICICFSSNYDRVLFKFLNIMLGWDNENPRGKERTSPFLPAHSMSKLRTLSGAILCQSPSVGWLIKSAHPTSTSYWHKVTWRTEIGRWEQTHVECQCQTLSSIKTRQIESCG